MPANHLRGHVADAMPEMQRLALGSLQSSASARHRYPRRYCARHRKIPCPGHVTLPFGSAAAEQALSRRISRGRRRESHRLIPSSPTRCRRHHGASLRCARALPCRPAGNAAGAAAADIFMPRDVPFANRVEAVGYGANVTLVNGLISDCGRIVAERSISARKSGLAYPAFANHFSNHSSVRSA
jgi:hypothetical protein